MACFSGTRRSRKPASCFGKHSGWFGFCLQSFLATSLFFSAPFNHALAALWNKPAKLIVQPAIVELCGSQAEHGLLVTAVAADGTTADVTARSAFVSKQPKIISTAANGVCHALGDGRGEIVVTYNGKTERILVSATNTSQARLPSFRQDVLPVLTKSSCNAGNCHGKLAGQNGFKLSLRGFAPEWDYGWLTADLRSRRIDPARPEESLIVLKALGHVPHEGGQRFPEGSRAHRALTDWISARAPEPDASESDARGLEVLPGNRTLRPGDQQRLLVRAFYANGRARDVTWLTQFFSNDEATAQVSSDGMVRCLRSGETAIRAHFQGQVGVMTITIPCQNKVEPKMFAKKNNLVDEHVFKKLMVLRIPPSNLCDDAAFLRRAFLDTIGTLPEAEEVRAFVSDKQGDKRARLIERLLARPEFVDYWTLQFCDLLQNRKERDHDVRGTKGVRSFHSWLRSQMAVNRPWNELAREILTAKGDSVRQPQVGYYITTVGENKPEESEAGDSVAQAFLGTRIGCAKCHNHPLEKYTQDDYYHFNAFFARVSLKRESPEKGATVLSAASREEEEQRKQVEQAEKNLKEAENAAEGKVGEEMDNAKNKIAERTKNLAQARQQLEKARLKDPTILQPRTKKSLLPQPLDGTVIAMKPGQDPREELADWIINPKTEYFAGAMVNRLWKHFLGVGLVEQVDDLCASNPPSNPALWKALQQEFVSHGYDLKELMRLILNSRTYQLSSVTLPGNEKDLRFYSHYYARRLPAEVLMDAVSRTTGVPDEFSGYPKGIRAIQLPEPGVASYFLSLFGRSDRVTACACERRGEVTLPQLLHMQNGEELTKKLNASESRLKGLLKESDDTRVTEEVFLMTLSRQPTGEEKAACQKVLAANSPRHEVYADLFWALLNTKEFAFNH